MASSPRPDRPRPGLARGVLRSVARLLDGPHPGLPAPVDALSEGWARLRPRVRSLIVLSVLLALVAVTERRVDVAEARWGGEPRVALIATEPLAVGSHPQALREVRLPPGAVPADAVHAVPDGAVLALALPRGAVLTAAHVDPRGPAAGLSSDLRAVPVPTEDGWGVVAGGWVDVWVLAPASADPATLVARSRPVLEVRGEGGSTETALLGLASEEVSPVTTALAAGRVLLTHAPPPSD